MRPYRVLFNEGECDVQAESKEEAEWQAAQCFNPWPAKPAWSIIDLTEFPDDRPESLDETYEEGYFNAHVDDDDDVPPEERR